MRTLKLSAVVGAAFLALGLAAGPASAAPAGAAAAAATERTTDGVQQVHYRRYRHCHGPSWDRWCHGPHYGYYDYYGGPGINLYIGPRPRWRRHHHHHHH